MKRMNCLAIRLSALGLVVPIFVIGAPRLASAGIVESGDVVDSGGNKTVGETGVGSLTVNDGTANALPGLLHFGNQSGSMGTGLVSGAGSELAINGILRVGIAGDGEFTISSGGKASTTGTVNIGQNPGGTGQMLVTGSGSSFAGGGDRFYVGGDGTGTLTVEDNASILALSQSANEPIFYIGSNASGYGTVNVRSGAVLDTTTLHSSNSLLLMGQDGSGELNIENGGSVLAERIRINLTGSGQTSTINVTGSGSNLSIANYIRVAAGAGSTATVNVSDYATVTNQTSIWVGDTVGDSGALNISDHGSVIANEDFFVGQFGNGTLSITDGGSLEVADDAYIAWDDGVAVVDVLGAGSTMSAVDRFLVGWGSPGAPATATLNVGRGGVVSAPANAPSAGSGFGLAIAADDVAMLQFTIGDDGSGTVDSGHVNAGAFFFGPGTAILDLVVDSGVTLAMNDKFTLVDYTRWDNNYFANIVDDAILTSGGYTFLINYNDDLGGGNLALTATVVPEPGTLALVILGGIAVVRRRSCQRKGSYHA
ncbi:MAG: PEP-CTERM sorting domain-containing protein [Phycisphaerales bacterium]|nr:PEP-CTERM sorting domain-containing protein [Phycisphaerales bacterium]